MQNVEAMKIILEIIVIFLTFPEYAPLLALVVVLGTLYSLLNREDKGDK
jgi:F0F1-type ATP synthase membrane subunit c/vacuolar-type H+-ATPase subunit K